MTRVTSNWLRAWLAAAALLLCIAAGAGVWASPARAAQPQNSSATANADSDSQSDNDSGGRVALARGKKLVLTDGSFQMVREYEKQGDRVRFFSTERGEWEEIPASMVDFAATEKAGSDTDAAQKATLDKLHSAAAVEISNSIDTGSSLLIGPGVFLPDSAGLYVLNGKAVLGLIQTEATSRLDKGRAILKGISGVPLISTKHIIEVPGKQAKIRLQTSEPEFFFRTADGRAPQMTLVKTEVKGDKREVTTAVTDLVGQTKYESHEVAVMVSEAARGVQRMTISKQLEPGEYALLEMTNDGVSSYVWDFGVDGGASSAASDTKNTKSTPKGKQANQK